jgi:hypothetical protein
MKTILEIDIVKKYSEHYGKSLYSKMLTIEGETEDALKSAIDATVYKEISTGLEYIVNNLIIIEDIDSKFVELADLYFRRLASNDIAGMREVLTCMSILNIEVLNGNRNDIEKVVEEDWTSKAIFDNGNDCFTCYISDRKVSLSTAIYTFFRDKRSGIMPSDEVNNLLRIDDMIEKLSPSIPITESTYQLEDIKKMLNASGIYYLIMYR